MTAAAVALMASGVILGLVSFVADREWIRAARSGQLQTYPLRLDGLQPKAWARRARWTAACLAVFGIALALGVHLMP